MKLTLILAPEMFNLKNVLTDIFGKSGRANSIRNCSGKSVDQIIASLSPNVRKKSDQIRENSGQRNLSRCCIQASDLSGYHKAS
ncbi:Mobile element protein [Methanosarcina sp. WH1]|nr:Mobile element protein [Methanosarcina sp. WH1]